MKQKTEREILIEKLEKTAAAVLDLKKEEEEFGHRPKRPIVIEFSGSPKSGKTSCINSLELFLKRNGFKVSIIHELASISPIDDKESPAFNIWTACMSLSEMLAILENEVAKSNCDVLLIDRGIFDALCWFNWLSLNQKIDRDQKKLIDNFLLIDDFAKRIDIVFSFCVNPEISIKREYANLLTNKLGTIMNEEVLTEYLESIKLTIKKRRKHFHKVLEIDTSDMDQDNVGEKVTNLTLETLKDLLMERIGYIAFTPSLKNQLLTKAVHTYNEIKSCISDIKFDFRSDIENNGSALQFIPILVLTNSAKNKILTVKKSPKAITADSPEKDKLLIYVGGHSRNEDATQKDSKNFLAVCRTTLGREMKEEIGIRLSLDDIIPFAIYTPTSSKSKQHIAICFVKEIDTNSVKLTLDPNELVQNRGTSKSGQFLDISYLQNNINELDTWGVEILDYVFNASTMAFKNQLSIDSYTY
ncbi:hypothetical protein LJC56_01080 [Christensenellaceae bacterium OttesenSCG-928-K19]|nr:hypothetical protein [Christensenellaceae bacterium OttesenSCG-928-K19]